VCANHIDLRYGLLFRLRVPSELIARIRRPEPGDLVVSRATQPNLAIELVHAIDAERLFGTRKLARAVALTTDADFPLASLV
jgi:hypothetical protein